MPSLCINIQITKYSQEYLIREMPSTQITDKIGMKRLEFRFILCFHPETVIFQRKLTGGVTLKVDSGKTGFILMRVMSCSPNEPVIERGNMRPSGVAR